MLNERKLSKSELSKREQIVLNMKKNKRSLVKKYGKDAEKVMYGRATNMAKYQAENKLREAVKNILNPKPKKVYSELTERIFSRLKKK